jgi:hypothetical protein
MTRDLLVVGVLAGIVVLIVLGAEFAGDVHRAERWLGRLLMPSAGAHSDPAREVGTSARTPSPLEAEAAAGGAPDLVQSGAPRRGTGPFRSSALLSDGELADLDARVDALSRPVNGRNLGTMPRKQVDGHPPWTEPIPRVTAPQPVAAWHPGAGVEPLNPVRPYLPEMPDVTA